MSSNCLYEFWLTKTTEEIIMGRTNSKAIF
jgi:hypothetical protein